MQQAIVFDCETGGLNAKTCSLLSIGYLIVTFPTPQQILEATDIVALADSCTQFRREIKIKHDVYHVQTGALKANKIDLITHEADALELRPALDLFEADILEHTTDQKRLYLMGHNVAFDRSFLEEALTSTGKKLSFHFPYTLLDTAGLAFFLDQNGVANIGKPHLDAILRWANIQIATQDRHTALGDAQVTWQAWLAESQQMLRRLKDSVNEQNNPH